jgi:putative flavoprotein involved in K+ transport
MPEMHFLVRWPSGREMRCYSPSLVVYDYLEAGETYRIPDFLARVRSLYRVASERVRAKYGFACSAAMDQLAAIEEQADNEGEKDTPHAGTFGPGARVTVLAFEGPSKPASSFVLGAHHTVVVVGAGQAGLAVSYLLKQREIDHVVLEKNRIGHEWRTRRWDSFCLVTPNWQCRLPGFPYAGDDPQGFMGKDEIVRYVEDYARFFQPPLLTGTAVTSVRPRREGGFVVTSSAGTCTADHVVVATGGYHIPSVPRISERLPASIVQLHSSAYRRPEDLPPGAVAVVGSGQSGCQVAEDLHIAGRTTHLFVGSAPRTARRYRGRDVVAWLEDMGYYAMPVHEHPLKERVRAKANHYVTGRDGGRDIDLRQRAREGMRLHGRLLEVGGEGGDTLTLADDLTRNLDNADAVSESIKDSIDKFIASRGLEAPVEARYEAVWRPDAAAEARTLSLGAEGITSIIWATGYRPDYGWLEAPVFDGRGAPCHERGVSPLPGLFFIGLPWLYTWGSGRFSGVADDAAYLVDQIARALASRHLPPTAGHELNELALGS